MSIETAKKIISDNYYAQNDSFVYFDPNDAAVMGKFPPNYNAFIERIDFAVRAYFFNDISLLEDEGFELQK